MFCTEDYPNSISFQKCRWSNKTALFKETVIILSCPDSWDFAHAGVTGEKEMSTHSLRTYE